MVEKYLASEKDKSCEARISLSTDRYTMDDPPGSDF
jgi:hypothetical protein